MSTKQKLSWRMIGMVLVLMATAALVAAQQPSPSPSPQKSDSSTPTESGEDAGDYTVISSVEFGYRGMSVSGDHNKYQSDLNYRTGRACSTVRSCLDRRTAKALSSETLLVNSTGWGADPQAPFAPVSNSRNSTASTRPIDVSSISGFLTISRTRIGYSVPQFSVPPKPVTGEHGHDTRIQLGDFDLLCSRRTISSGSTSDSRPNVTVDQHSLTITRAAMNSSRCNRLIPAPTISA